MSNSKIELLFGGLNSSPIATTDGHSELEEANRRRQCAASVDTFHCPLPPRSASSSYLPASLSWAGWEPGPYRLTRNPMYVGFALVHAGLALRRRSTWALSMLGPVLAVVDRVVIRREERYLERTFGEEYRSYAGRVSRWL